MKLTEERECQVSVELINWADETKTYSYYDCLTHAYDNDLHDWVAFLNKRQNKTFLSTYLKSKKRSDKAKYEDTMIEASLRMLDAKSRYLERNKIYE